MKINTEVPNLYKDLITAEAYDKQVREKLNSILNLEGVDIELCGRWIWITGNTLSVKEYIKQAGFYWAKQKKAWYWRSEEDRSYNRKACTIDEIRQSYGSIAIKTTKLYALAG